MTGDLDITVVGQLPSTNLPFGDQFEPRPVKVVRFEAAFRCRSIWKQNLENAPGDAHHTLIFADAYTELDDRSLGVPASIGRKAKEHGPPGKCSTNVLPNMPGEIRRVDSALFEATGRSTSGFCGYARKTPFVEAARRQPRRSAKLALAEAGGE
jgi:hypothetical protein